MSAWASLLSPKIAYLLDPLGSLVIFVAIITQRGRTAHLELLDGFYVLAFFGLFHGLADSILIWQVFNAAQPLPAAVLLARFALYILSFQFLLYFVFMMFIKPETRVRWFIYFTPLVLGVHYVVATRLSHDLDAAFRSSNWLIAFPTALLAGIAFFVLSRKLGYLHLNSLMWDARALTVSFLMYGISKMWCILFSRGCIIPPTPILVVRTISGLATAFFVVRILALFKLKPSKRSA